MGIANVPFVYPQQRAPPVTLEVLKWDSWMGDVVTMVTVWWCPMVWHVMMEHLREQRQCTSAMMGINWREREGGCVRGTECGMDQY